MAALAESLAPLFPVAWPRAGARSPGGRLPVASQMNVHRSFFLLPRQGTAEADTFHVAGFWPDDV